MNININEGISYLSVAVTILVCAICAVPEQTLCIIAGFGFGSIAVPKIIKILVDG